MSKIVNGIFTAREEVKKYLSTSAKKYLSIKLKPWRDCCKESKRLLYEYKHEHKGSYSSLL